jgi:hypothetical protein
MNIRVIWADGKKDEAFTVECSDVGEFDLFGAAELLGVGLDEVNSCDAGQADYYGVAHALAD